MDDEVDIDVQNNGKIRAKLMVDYDLNKQAGEEQLPKAPQVAELIEGRQLVKAIYVPGRLLNLIVK